MDNIVLLVALLIALTAAGIYRDLIIRAIKALAARDRDVETSDHE